MNEQEWFTSIDPQKVLQHLTGQPSSRKLKLATVACCRQMRSLLVDERSIRAVDSAELYADKSHDVADVSEIETQATQVVDLSRDVGTDPQNAAAHCAALCLAHWAPADWGALQVFRWSSPIVSRFVQVAILACVFAIPYRNRRIQITANPTWLTSTVMTLAKQMYESRDFSAMPILADALQDAGCENEDMLNHCRGPGPHVRGCWVVDLVLGKA
ncbi:MAG TPA: hypothetical protein VLM40_05145 [Gemmata sp.]|nr:hypothetical protein [Gemmata sp.]